MSLEDRDPVPSRALTRQPGAEQNAVAVPEIRQFAGELAAQLFQRWQVALQEQFQDELRYRLGVELEHRAQQAVDLRQEVHERRGRYTNAWNRRHGPYGHATFEMEQTLRRQSSELVEMERQMREIRERLRAMGREPAGSGATVEAEAAARSAEPVIEPVAAAIETVDQAGGEPEGRDATHQAEPAAAAEAAEPAAAAEAAEPTAAQWGPAVAEGRAAAGDGAEAPDQQPPAEPGESLLALTAADVRELAAGLADELFEPWEQTLSEQFQEELGQRLEEELTHREHEASDLRVEVEERQAIWEGIWSKRHPRGLVTDTNRWEMEQRLRRQSAELAETERAMREISERLRDLGEDPDRDRVIDADATGSPPAG